MLRKEFLDLVEPFKGLEAGLGSAEQAATPPKTSIVQGRHVHPILNPKASLFFLLLHVFQQQ